jgi:hypothetical protein
MKVVYRLTEAMKADPEEVALTRALTLDQSKPTMGLKGNLGLYGSQQWWDNIEQGKMPLLRLSGFISDVYVAGQDEDDLNTVDIKLADGSVHPVGIYVNDETDSNLYQIDSRLEIVYALDRLKRQPDADGSANYSPNGVHYLQDGVNYLQIPLEIAVSLRPGR